MKEVRKYADLFSFGRKLIEYEGKTIDNLQNEFYLDIHDLFAYFASNSYVGLVDEKIVPTGKLKKEIGTDPNLGPVEEWINRWRLLFPSGINGNGYRYRGDRGGCISKMKKFIKENPDVTKNEIFKATENYITKINYGIPIKMAHYFIYKDNTSDLLAEIENLRENGTTGKDEIDWA